MEIPVESRLEVEGVRVGGRKSVHMHVSYRGLASQLYFLRRAEPVFLVAASRVVLQGVKDLDISPEITRGVDVQWVFFSRRFVLSPC
jgi:hypothetical protein